MAACGGRKKIRFLLATPMRRIWHPYRMVWLTPVWPQNLPDPVSNDKFPGRSTHGDASPEAADAALGGCDPSLDSGAGDRDTADPEPRDPDRERERDRLAERERLRLTDPDLDRLDPEAAPALLAEAGDPDLLPPDADPLDPDLERLPLASGDPAPDPDPAGEREGDLDPDLDDADLAAPPEGLPDPDRGDRDLPLPPASSSSPLAAALASGDLSTSMFSTRSASPSLSESAATQWGKPASSKYKR